MADDSRALVSIIGVYMPCLDKGSDCYRQHLLELERVISESVLFGPVVILGNYNAHLGFLGGERGEGNPNLQGVLLSEVMSRCNLSAISLSSMATEPHFTYVSGKRE